MTPKLKTGKEIISDFFAKLGERPDLDKKLVNAFQKLFTDGKLSSTHVSNALLAHREEAMNEQAKKD